MNRFEHYSGPALKEEEEEPCCDNPDITISDDGIRVCRNCGLTFGQELVSSERRAYTPEEVRARRRTKPAGGALVRGLSSPESKQTRRGGNYPPKNRPNLLAWAKFKGLSSILSNAITGKAKPKLHALATKMTIPDYIVETAWKIYSEVAQQKLTMGRSIEAFVCASLYASIRIHDFPRLLEELTDVAMIPLRSVHRSLGLIVRNVLPGT